MKNKSILVIAAHPDDEILGCGGTIARLVKEGYEAYTLILSGGKASRNNVGNQIKEEKRKLEIEARKANAYIGVKELFFADFPDNKLDSIPLLDIVKSIELIKKKVNPEIVFTHFRNDLNIDHKITYDATITATRPLPGESVKEIYSYEVLSSTEWNFPISFSPEVFFDVTDYFECKINAMRFYESELREYPHSRSLQAMNENAKTWAFKNGVKGYVEAFKMVRRFL